ncbi:MAG: hypothetical protein ABI333_24215 [bacterium]
MKRLIGLILTLGFCLAMAGGCAAEEARCEEACRHQCDLCDQSCSEEDIAICAVSCENMDTEPDRTDCVLAAPTCDDIWEC